MPRAIWILFSIIFVLMLASPAAAAKTQRSYSTSPYVRTYSTCTRHSYTYRAPRTPRRFSRSPGLTRDSHGRISRSTAAKNAFKRQQPCPSTGRSSGACPGYVIDHVRPLECGGADAPSNMQWQTIAAGKAKDRTERNCR